MSRKLRRNPDSGMMLGVFAVLGIGLAVYAMSKKKANSTGSSGAASGWYSNALAFGGGLTPFAIQNLTTDEIRARLNTPEARAINERNRNIRLAREAADATRRSTPISPLAPKLSATPPSGIGCWGRKACACP